MDEQADERSKKTDWHLYLCTDEHRFYFYQLPAIGSKNEQNYICEKTFQY